MEPHRRLLRCSIAIANIRNRWSGVRVRTVTLLLLTMWVLCFAVGAYAIYAIWVEHDGPYGPAATGPLGLPDIRSHLQPKLKLGA